MTVNSPNICKIPLEVCSQGRLYCLAAFLTDFLPGNCFTLLIACISPADSHSDESMNTLRYAERSRSIANNVKRNALRPVNVSPTENALQQENHRLRAELNEVRRRMMQAENKENPGSANLSHIEEKIRRAKEEAKVTRESCLNVANQVSRWRDRRAVAAKETFRTVSDAVSGSLLGFLNLDVFLTYQGLAHRSLPVHLPLTHRRRTLVVIFFVNSLLRSVGAFSGRKKNSPVSWWSFPIKSIRSDLS